MTAITIAAPHQLRGRARRQHQAPARRLTAVPVVPARRAPSTRPTRVASAAAPRPSAALRLTRRGRLAVLGLLLAVAAAVSLLAGGTSLAGTSAGEHPAVRYLTVASGDTLWGIAGSVAPHDDRRDTVQRIVELNALSGSSVQAGQRLAVPVG